jgi:hypothetical protein
MQIRQLLNILEQLELGAPYEPRDPKDMSVDELEAEIARVEKDLAHITPVDQTIDAINGDKIIQKISPRDLERREQGLPPNPNIRHPIYNLDPTADPESTELKA